MQRSATRKILTASFWISVVLHLLLVLSFSTIFIFNTPIEEKKKTPKHFVPSYVYKGAITPSMPTPAPSMPTQPVAPTTLAKEAPKPAVESGINSEVQQERSTLVRSMQQKKSISAEKNENTQKSVMHATREVLQQNQRNAIHASKETDPIYLIGDDSSEADPLIKLMGRALSAHFEYPRLAGELGIRGRVIISLTLHPEGYFSDVEMIRSSDNQDLDAAALYAVNSAPHVPGVDRFLDKPKHFVIGFIFR